MNVIEAGASGGLVAAETAAISEVAKAAGKVAEIVVDEFEGRRTSPTTKATESSAPIAPQSGLDKLMVSINVADLPSQTVFALIEKWARDRNLIDGSNPQAQFLKVTSELGELADAILKRDMPKVIDGIGDVIVVLVVIAAQHGLSVTDCINAAYTEIKDRKGVMYNGAFVKSDDSRYEGILAELAAKQSSGGQSGA